MKINKKKIEQLSLSDLITLEAYVNDAAQIFIQQDKLQQAEEADMVEEACSKEINKRISSLFIK